MNNIPTRQSEVGKALSGLFFVCFLIIEAANLIYFTFIKYWPTSSFFVSLRVILQVLHGDRIFVPIHWHLSKLKKTYIGEVWQPIVVQ